MSDAMTDIDRDSWRVYYYRKYLDALKVLLRNPTLQNEQFVIDAVIRLDGVGMGYWTKRTNHRETLGDLVVGLLAEDKEVWNTFLDGLREKHRYEEFRALSPFADKRS